MMCSEKFYPEIIIPPTVTMFLVVTLIFRTKVFDDQKRKKAADEEE